MDEENIRLRLVSPGEPSVELEADEEIDLIVPQQHEGIYLAKEEVGSNGEDDVDMVSYQEQFQSGDVTIHLTLENDPDPLSQPVDVDMERDENVTVSLEDCCSTQSPPGETGDRVTFLENEMKRSKCRLDGFSQELKVLLVEVNIVCDWIMEHFGVQLIDRASQLFKHIHDFEEVEEMAQKLSLLKKGKSTIRRSARMKPKPKRPSPTTRIQPKRKRGRGRPKKKVRSDSEGSEDEEVEGAVEAESREFFEPPECLLNTDVDEDFFKEDSKRRRRRIKKRQPAVLAVNPDSESVPEEVKGVKEEGKEDEENQDGRKKKKWKSQPRSLQCEECGKILKADSSLRWHMLMHADLRPVQCTEPGCGKTFRDKSKLAQHYKIHGSEKNEKCRYCDRGFLRKKDLVVHERTHTGEKPYSCPTCLKSFNIKDHLTIHLRVHTGERPYKCPTCEKSFSQANSLRIHKKIHLKNSSDYVPTPRKPRAPRKPKVPPGPEVSSSPVSGSGQGDKDDPRPSSVHEVEVDPLPQETSGSGLPGPGPTTTEHQSSSTNTNVQTFFQPQTLNLVEPAQQTWNFVPAGPNDITAVSPEHHHHHQQHPHQQHHQPQLNHQRSFHTQAFPPLSVSQLSVVQGHGGGATFKLQPIPSYHSQSSQQLGQNVVIRNPLSGQGGGGGPFIPTQFHDPTLRHFQN